MRAFVITVLILFVSAAAGHSDITLYASPVHQAFYQSLHADDWEEQTDDQALSSGNDVPGKKSVVKAAVLSALIPGAGEYYLGNKTKARYFFAVEALTWVGFATFRIYSNWKEDDYVRFAALHANAQLEDKSEEFRDLVGFYDDIDQYNSFGRIFDPERPYLEDTEENHWRWDTEDSRGTYRHLKNRSKEAERRSEFMIGLAIVNRIVSIIDTIRDGKRLSSAIDSGELSDGRKPYLKFKIDPFDDTRQVSLTLFTDFK